MGYEDPPTEHSYANGTVWWDNDGTWMWNQESGNWIAQGSTEGGNISAFTGIGPKLPIGNGNGNDEGLTFDSINNLIVGLSLQDFDSDKYKYDQYIKKDNFRAKDPKCSLYCGDRYKRAHIDFVKMSNKLEDGERPGNWWLYDLGIHLPGFKKITDPKDIIPGDLVVLHPKARGPFPGGNYFGHSIIPISKDNGIWKALEVPGSIVVKKNGTLNDYIKNYNDKFVVWRYIGIN